MELLMYVQDHDGVFPNFSWEQGGHFGWFSTKPGRMFFTWEDQIQPYVKNWNVFVCPSRTSGGWEGLHTYGLTSGAFVSDYWQWNNWNASKKGSFLTEAEVVQPGDRIMTAKVSARRTSVSSPSFRSTRVGRTLGFSMAMPDGRRSSWLTRSARRPVPETAPPTSIQIRSS